MISRFTTFDFFNTASATLGDEDRQIEENNYLGKSSRWKRRVVALNLLLQSPTSNLHKNCLEFFSPCVVVEYSRI